MNGPEYTYLQNKKWRAISYNWDTLSTYGNDSRLYCLTDFQAAWLLSNTEYMRWGSRWENCPCTQSDLDAMKAELDYNLMNCLDFQPYQLQALYDNAQNALIQDYVDAWDGSLPSSVNPNAPDDYFNGDGSSDRNDALCTALTLWGYSYALAWSQKASTILGVADVATFLVSLMVPFGGELATRVISQLTAPLQATLDAINNQTALDTVICDWRANLVSTAITPTNWSSGVVALSYPTDSDEDYIQQLFADDSQLLENFLSFVNALGDAYELAQINVYICPCEETWTYTIDFTLFPGFIDGWRSDGWTDGWSLSDGWSSQDAPGSNENLYIACDLPSPAQVTYYSFTYASTAYTNFPSASSRFLVGRYNDGSSTIETYRVNSNGLTINATRVQYDSVVPLTVEWLACANNPYFPTGKWYLVGAEIRGVGPNPFS